MVPYMVTIPGTDVSFTMQPIPGGKFKLGSPESEKEEIAAKLGLNPLFCIALSVASENSRI